MDSSSSLHIAMYPWFAMGHQSAFIHLANKLAKKGHTVTFFTPKSAQSKLQPFNLHPQSITFVTITVPRVEGLPPNAETTADVPFPLQPHIMTAMDLTQPDIQTHLTNLKPHIVFYDFTHWIPSLTKRLGIKAIHYCTASSVMVGYTLTPARYLKGTSLTEFDLMEPPSGYPDSSIKLYNHEAKIFVAKRKEIFGSNVLFYDRQAISLNEADALGFRTCKEIEGPYLDYIHKQFNKPVLTSGPVILEKPNSVLDENWSTWLAGFKTDSVVYCCFGSECVLRPNLFQELMLGLELTGIPFFAALKPPFGFATLEEALPEGFAERTKGRGVVYGGWVQQQLILEHPSVGCFITHCGSGSLSEALVNKCQLVLLPNYGDQILNARMMGNNLKVGVEVEKGEDGLYTKDSVCKAVSIVMEDENETSKKVRVNHAKIREMLLNEDGLYTKDSVCKAVSIVMDDENETSKKVRVNHAKIREMLLNEDLESSYIDDFCNKLQEIVTEKN